MTLTPREEAKLRSALAVLVDATPPGREFDDLAAPRLEPVARRRRGLAIAAAAFVAVLAAGGVTVWLLGSSGQPEVLAPAATPPPPDTVPPTSEPMPEPPPGFAARVAAATAGLALPPGAEPPTTPAGLFLDDVDPPDEQLDFVLVTYARCAWRNTWIRAYVTGDGGLQAEAEAAFAAMPEWPKVVAASQSSDLTSVIEALARAMAREDLDTVEEIPQGGACALHAAGLMYPAEPFPVRGTPDATHAVLGPEPGFDERQVAGFVQPWLPVASIPASEAPGGVVALGTITLQETVLVAPGAAGDSCVLVVEDGGATQQACGPAGEPALIVTPVEWAPAGVYAVFAGLPPDTAVVAFPMADGPGFRQRPAGGVAVLSVPADDFGGVVVAEAYDAAGNLLLRREAPLPAG